MGSDQRDLNRETWAALQGEGFTPGSSLEVEAFFYSTSEESASGLARELGSRGWSVSLSATRRGILRRRWEWGVTATRTVVEVDAAALDAMVDELEDLAAAHGSDFDGWGAELPGS